MKAPDRKTRGRPHRTQLYIHLIIQLLQIVHWFQRWVHHTSHTSSLESIEPTSRTSHDFSDSPGRCLAGPAICCALPVAFSFLAAGRRPPAATGEVGQRVGRTLTTCVPGVIVAHCGKFAVCSLCLHCIGWVEYHTGSSCLEDAQRIGNPGKNLYCIGSRTSFVAGVGFQAVRC